MLALITTACQSGARLKKVCEIIGLSIKTVQRWRKNNGGYDRRTTNYTPPSNKLTDKERARIIAVVNSDKYQGLSPSQIVPMLADEGVYLASESTIYRILKSVGQLRHRQATRPSHTRHRPKSLTAMGPNQVYSWDITYLPTRIKGQFLYLYLVIDIYSRKIVGWQVYEYESSDLAADLMRDICEREGVAPGQVTLHSDNGGPMKIQNIYNI